MTAAALVLVFGLQAVGAPGAAEVTGQVLTRDGVPAAAVRVSAIVAPPPDARPQDGSQYYQAPPPVRSVMTGVDGRYRLPNLPPGRYHIVAGVLGQATYYPSTLDPLRASVVAVGPGSKTERVDLRLAVTYGGRVRGRLNPPPSGPGEIAVLSGLRLEELLEVPVGADGWFEFGHVPRGAYLVSISPAPPGLASLPLEVGDADVTSIELARPAVRRVSGRIVVNGSALPPALLAFSTATSYVSATIAPDGTFTARLQAGRHATDLGGLPVGYAVASVRLGSQDVSRGLVVSAADIDGLVVTVSAPRDGGRR
jgi:hypothetical protein